MAYLELLKKCFSPFPLLIGEPSEADVIIVLGMGRHKGYSDHDEYRHRLYGLKTSDTRKTLINQLFCGYKLGEPNKSLALEAKELSIKYSLPIIAQVEVGGVFGPKWHKEINQEMFYIWPSPRFDSPLSAPVALMEAKAIMEKNKYEKAILVDHAWRIKSSYRFARGILPAAPIVVEQKTKCFFPEAREIRYRNVYFWLVFSALTGNHFVDEV